MQITIRAGGIIRNGPERELVDNYIKRANGLGSRVGISKVDEEQVDLRNQKTRAAETKAILKTSTPGKIQIILDERGKQLTSRQIANSLVNWRDQNEREVEIAIGGADGFEPNFVPTGVVRWAFGPQTWPHKIVRVMIAEQIYRALSILAATPYHRE